MILTAASDGMKNCSTFVSRVLSRRVQSLSQLIQTEARSGAPVMVQKLLLGLTPWAALRAWDVSHVAICEDECTSSPAQQMLALLDQCCQEKMD